MDVLKADVRALKAAEKEKDKQVYDASKSVSSTCIRQHTSAYVSIPSAYRQHTSAYVASKDKQVYDASKNLNASYTST
jgi:hypothetical protein